MRFLFLIILGTIFISINSSAQSKYYRGAIGAISGSTQYGGDINLDYYQFRNVNVFSGLSYSHYLSKHFDVRLNAAFGSWGYDSDVNYSFNADFFNVNVDSKIKLSCRENPRWTPYIFAGIGLNQFSNWTLFNLEDEIITTDQGGGNISYDDMNRLTGVISGGPGIQVRLADRVFINLEERFLFPATDASDGIRKNNFDNMLRHTIGVSFGVAPWNDSDHDGVNDRLDKCPATPSIARVDEFGCPLDSDLDGVSDYEDQCITLAGHLSAHGCPDSDGDSFPDYQDACPDVHGKLALGGCPDSDDDGIKDSDDRCPESRGSCQHQGCPDSDEDGVADPDDRCPDTSKMSDVDVNGCELDKDEDGVADYKDQCPDVAGSVNHNGCPEIKAEVTALFQRALTGIKFESGKDVIRKESYYLLDSVVIVMNENPSFKLRIAGHTDNVGNAQKNLELSDKRAKAVKKYLVTHGIADVRILSAVGFGQEKPVADNATEEGRATNRRVEFSIEF